MAYINCNSCSVLQREYLMRSRCVAYLLSASELNTCAVPACVFSSEVVEDDLLVWEGASACLERVWRHWQCWSRSHERSKTALLTAPRGGAFNEIAVYTDERCVFNESVSAHNRLAILYCCVAAAISLCITAPVETKFLKEHTQFDPASFSRCHLDRVLLNAVATCPPVMFMITASRVWASHMQRWHSWMVHVLTGGTWPSQC